MVSSNYTYYVYGSTIARFENASCKLEMKSHKDDKWNTVKQPDAWKRVQEEGNKVSKEEAEKMYDVFHKNINGAH